MDAKKYDPAGAAQFLGGDTPIPTETLSYWRRIGKGPQFVKLGRHVRYLEADLIAYQEQQRRQSTSQAA